jgi:hypothetical protein
MTDPLNLDRRRRAALDQVHKSEQRFRYLMVGVFLWEAVLLAVIILYMDFGDRMHVLIFLSTAIVYGTLGIGLVTLGAYLRQNTLQILAALELVDKADRGPEA